MFQLRFPSLYPAIRLLTVSLAHVHAEHAAKTLLDDAKLHAGDEVAGTLFAHES